MINDNIKAELKAELKAAAKELSEANSALAVFMNQTEKQRKILQQRATNAAVRMSALVSIIQT